ncbi:hypothetical protein PF005_g26486 [Phytophthora fragariae]|uniref:Uncharacterized protein n=2 Tax=Phytophthora fragariae TaxID=53985 RepID=A0A6A4BS09_9STRA|nr:hypothetical protein PF005_g26486 [Phytophthora fragariae]KAE9276902.1 hypothetical protein PF001_g25911 [Phytophthora fragariae]
MLPAGRALAAPPGRAPAATLTAPQHQDDPGAAQGAEDDRASAASRPADPANDDGRPGRAAGMLPVPVAPGAAQAATTRTLKTTAPPPAAPPKTPRMSSAHPAGRPAGCPPVVRPCPRRPGRARTPSPRPQRRQLRPPRACRPKKPRA